jgi:hypothetical protein
MNLTRRLDAMKNYFRISVAGVVGLIVFLANLPLQAAPRKTEAELIQMLYSGDYHKINDALDRLPNWYPNSTNAILIIEGMLRSNATMIVTQSFQHVSQPASKNAGVREEPTPILLPHMALARMAARALGIITRQWMKLISTSFIPF